LRDPSHVRNYRPSEWRDQVVAAGLTVLHEEVETSVDGRPLDFDDWVTRMRTPADVVGRLRNLFANASEGLVKFLDIQIEEGKLTFRLPQIVILAEK